MLMAEKYGQVGVLLILQLLKNLGPFMTSVETTSTLRVGLLHLKSNCLKRF